MHVVQFYSGTSAFEVKCASADIAEAALEEWEATRRGIECTVDGEPRVMPADRFITVETINGDLTLDCACYTACFVVDADADERLQVALAERTRRIQSAIAETDINPGFRGNA